MEQPEGSAEFDRILTRVNRAIEAAKASRDEVRSGEAGLEEAEQVFATSAGDTMKELVALSSRLLAARLYQLRGSEAVEDFPEFVRVQAEMDAEEMSDLLNEADASAGEAILMFGSALKS